MPRRMLTSDTKQLWHPFIRSIRNPAIRHSSGRNSLTRAHPASISPPSASAPPPPLSALLSSKTATGLEFPTSTPAPASAASIITSFSKKLILNSSSFSTPLSSSHQFLVHRKQQQQQQPLNRRLYSSTTTTMASATSFYDFKPLDSTSCITHYPLPSIHPPTHPPLHKPPTSIQPQTIR